jgi:hypothetical protein
MGGGGEALSHGEGLGPALAATVRPGSEKDEL